MIKKTALLKTFDLAMLFFGKTGSVIVGFIFIPLYNKALGIESFGIIAIILSFQTLILTIDFGVSTLVNRDVAASISLTESSRKTIVNSERLMTVFYLSLFVVGVLYTLVFGSNRFFIFLISCSIMFWCLMIQNIHFSALLGSKNYIYGGMLQFFSVTFRAAVTLVVLHYIDATVEMFLLSQCIISILSLLLIKFISDREMLVYDPRKYKLEFNDLKKLLIRGKPLILASISAAVVMQLDKTIVAKFISPSDLVPYFLAFTFSMTPILMLAGPVKQYFQPKIITYFSNGSYADLNSELKYFVLILTFVTLIPAMVMWVYNESILNLWLGSEMDLTEISLYVEILLPGFVIGAIGYIPVVLLTAKQDYDFQSRLSIITTLIVMTFVIYYSLSANIKAICLIYSLYFSFVTIFCWIRCVFYLGLFKIASNILLFNLLVIVFLIGVFFMFSHFIFYS